MASAPWGSAANPHGVPVTGSSSASSAVGVAAGLTMLSVGTETSGSLLSPAAWNSVVAMKPSRGVVDGRGIVPLLRNNDSAGPVARSVTDAALLLGVIGGRNDDHRAALKADALDGVTVGLLNQRCSWRRQRRAAADRGHHAADGRRPVATGATVAYPDWADPLAFLRLLAAGIRHDMMGYVASLGLPVRTLKDLMAYNQAQPQRRIPFGQEQLTRLLSLTGNTTVSAADFAAQARSPHAAGGGHARRGLREDGRTGAGGLDNEHSSYYATAGYPAVTVPLGVQPARWPARPDGRQPARRAGGRHADRQTGRRRPPAGLCPRVRAGFTPARGPGCAERPRPRRSRSNITRFSHPIPDPTCLLAPLSLAAGLTAAP